MYAGSIAKSQATGALPVNMLVYKHMNSRSLIYISAILAVALAGSIIFLAFKNRPSVSTPPPATNQATQTTDSSELPGPLRHEGIEDGLLTVKGTIAETNRQRQLNGRSSLKENVQLNRAAEAKLRDMFAKNYFAHESPERKGPADLATDAGYHYLLVGENLALGGFVNDVDLVQAWMDSPGHRENILKRNYKEIGVAVGEGIFDGKHTWLAVQEFGRPLSDCPPVNESLQRLLDANNKSLDVLEKTIEAKQNEINNTPRNSPEYNQKAAEYNDLVEQYNNLASRTKKMTEEYNAEVERYNSCLRGQKD